LIDAWASLKSFQPKEGPGNPGDGDPGNRSVDIHGDKRSNATHQSAIDPRDMAAEKAVPHKQPINLESSQMTDSERAMLAGMAQAMKAPPG